MKILCLIACLTITAAYARTGDVSYDFEVEKQLQQIWDRQPQSLSSQEQEKNEYMKKRYKHYHLQQQGQKKEHIEQ